MGETIEDRYDREYTSAVCHVCRDLWAEIARLTRELEEATEALTVSRTTAANLHDVIRRRDRELEEARERERKREQAAQTLCGTYFEIAAEAIGEDEVRRRRDERIAALATPPDTPSTGGSGGHLVEAVEQLRGDRGDVAR